MMLRTSVTMRLMMRRAAAALWLVNTTTIIITSDRAMKRQSCGVACAYGVGIMLVVYIRPG
jgi:threonine/homoserine efflux transporter RhtA